MGKDAARIIKECNRRRKPLPKTIREAPELRHGLGLYYEAFNELDTCRSFGMGVGPIPWSAVQEYALTYGYSTEQADDLHFFIQRMDVAYRKHVSKKSDSKTLSPKKS